MTRTGRLVIAGMLGAGAVAALAWLLLGEGLDRAEKWVSITVGIASLGVASAAYQLARRSPFPQPSAHEPLTTDAPSPGPASTSSPETTHPLASPPETMHPLALAPETTHPPAPRPAPVSSQKTAPAPKFQVDISGSQGVIVGDHGRQDVTFTDPR